MGSFVKYPQELDADGAIPSDIEQALTKFFDSTTDVCMDYDAMYNYRAYAFLSSLFMTVTRTFVKIDIVTLLFPNLQTFVMTAVPLTSLTFLYIKSVIGTNNVEEEKDDCKQAPQLREIKLLKPKTTAMSVDAVIEAEKRNFAAMQWTIEKLEENNVSGLILAYSNVPAVIKELTPTPIVVVEKEETKKEEEPKKKKKILVRRRKKKVPKQNEEITDAPQQQQKSE